MSTDTKTTVKPKAKSKPSNPTFTHEELQALLFAATNNQGIENTGIVAGNEATAKLREALKV